MKTDWTRVEALNVHSQVLYLYASTHTRLAANEIERTVKSSEGGGSSGYAFRESHLVRSREQAVRLLRVLRHQSCLP